MNSLLYAANISTFAAWLGISGASTVGILVNRTEILPELKKAAIEEIQISEGELLDVEMQSGGSAATSEIDVENNEEVIQQPEAVIPEIPAIAEMEPLPEVPDLPEMKPSQEAFEVEKPKQAAPKAEVKKVETIKRGSDKPVARRTESGSGTGSGSSASGGAGSGDTGSARFSGGRMPRPTYPASARKQGIEGTVRASITVDESGNVVSASIVSASHPALNDSSIISTLQRWKFKPGARATRILPIRFTLH